MPAGPIARAAGLQATRPAYFSSRQIERTTYENVAVRLLCADTHPDHDTLCAFLRKNGPLLSHAFAQILELAARFGVLKVGGIHRGERRNEDLGQREQARGGELRAAGQTMQTLDLEIAALLAKAAQADATPLQDGLTIPAEVQRREERKAQLARARAEMKTRAYARCQAEQAEHTAKRAARDAARAAEKKAPRTRACGPRVTPCDKDQVNFTDAESRIMKTKDGFQQCCNAQAGVETDSLLIVGPRVSQAADDKKEILPNLTGLATSCGPSQRSRRQWFCQRGSRHRRRT